MGTQTAGFPFAAACHGAPDVRRPIAGYEVSIVHMPHRRVETLRVLTAMHGAVIGRSFYTKY